MPNTSKRYARLSPPLLLWSVLLAGTFLWLFGCGNGIPSSPSSADADPRLDGERINSFYTNEEISYLLDVGLWHDTSLTAPSLRRWVSNIRIGTKGTTTPEDIAALREAVGDLQGLTGDISIAVDAEKPNLIVYFVPRAAFGFIRHDYSYPAFGFSSVSQSVFIQDATVLVAVDSTSQADRNGLIYRGIAASLGLTNPSSLYPESIFNSVKNPIPLPRFSSIDRIAIELLYSADLWPGMKRDDVIRALADR